MGGNPRVVAADVTFTWDRVPWRLQRGQIIDVPPGSALEQAIGADLLVPLGGAAPAPQPAAPAAEETPAQEDSQGAPRKSRAAAKAQDTGTDAPDSSSDDKDGDA